MYDDALKNMAQSFVTETDWLYAIYKSNIVCFGFLSARSLEERQNDALEEERRLCFVAITRARKKLYLTESEGFGVKGFSKTPKIFAELYFLSHNTSKKLCYIV